MKGLSHFQIVTKTDLSDYRGDVAYYSLRDNYREGRIEEAHHELYELIGACSELMRGFTFNLTEND
jgi:hypothetical protein